MRVCPPSLQLVAFAHDIVDDDEDFDEHLPFMAVEPRSKQKKTRRGGQRRKLSEEDALGALHGLRNELEVRGCVVGVWGRAVAGGQGIGRPSASGRVLGLVVRGGCTELAHVEPPYKLAAM